MYINPNTTIKILENIPLDSDYQHTINFSSVSQQYNYFNNFVKFDLYNYSYNRVNNNTIKVNIMSDKLYSCNYLMFQNSSFSNKWFYAFIKEVNYISNETSEIVYELDVMQTYHFDYNLEKCFIERQHTYSDKVGDNIIPEPFSCDDYEIGSEHNEFKKLKMGELCVCVLSTEDLTKKDNFLAEIFNGISFDGEIVKRTFQIYKGGMLGNNTLYVTNNQTFAFYLIETLNSKYGGNTIISVYLTPKKFFKDDFNGSVIGVVGGINYNPEDINQSIGKMITNRKIVTPLKNKKTDNIWGNWQPKNNKLYTAPYNLMVISDNNGNELNLEYEGFKHVNQAVFQIETTPLPPVNCRIYPLNYKSENNFENFEHQLYLTGWSTLPYSTDPYTAWLSQSYKPDLVGNLGKVALGGIVMGGLGALSGAGYLISEGVSNALTSGAKFLIGGSLFSQATNLTTNALKQNVKPNEFQGNNAGKHLLTSSGKLEYRCYNKHLRIEKAKIIDDFFTKYGYSYNAIGYPNRGTRENYCYVKTVGCSVTGNIPSKHAELISKIYDNGITFWVDGMNVKNYNISNRPLGEI